MVYDDLENTRIVSVSIDGSEKIEQIVPGAHHDMVELPDGIIATIVTSEAPKGWSTGAVSDTIVEIAPDGTWTEIWSSWVELDLKSAGVSGHDNWTLGNALDYVDEEDAYYLSMKSLGGMARVDRGTGATEWVLGSEIDDFEYEDGTEPVDLQHGVDRVAGGILIFDNGSPDRGYARVVELSLDEDEMTATEVWSYVRDPKVDVYAMGDVARLPDGNTQIVWSTSGEIRTVTPEGETVWKLNTDLGEGISYVQPLEAWGAY
jgi:arylsulfate sulfotransferase